MSNSPTEGIQLRPYQQEAVDSLYSYFMQNPDPLKNPVLALPTGTGKAIIIAKFIQGVLSAWPNQRIMMLTHVKELIDQNAKRLLEAWPQAPLGIYSAGLGEKTAHLPITFAGIQSAARSPDAFGHFDLVLIDECHLVAANDNASYKKFLAHLRYINPRLRVIGLSATPFRLGLGMITDGGVFTDISYDMTALEPFNMLLDEGYLLPPIPMQTNTTIDVSKVAKRGGEFIQSELQKVSARETITDAALTEVLQAAKSRNHCLIFATGIAHVEMIHDLLAKRGVMATFVHSKIGDAERNDNLKRFMNGEVKFLINADILTTGFDFPALDMIVMLRPTNSPGLHVQMLGRGTRPHYAPDFDLTTSEGRKAAIEASDKHNCLVLDFAGNTRRLGPINDVRIPGRKNPRPGDVPIKVCDYCGCLNHISKRVCDNCGEEFEFQEKITSVASTAEIVRRTEEPVVSVFIVDRVTYMPHNKPGSPRSLRVTYYCGIRRFSEWVCLEHYGSTAQRKAIRWWGERSTHPAPSTVNEALQIADDLRVPKQIRVWVNRKYPEILAHIFEE